MQTFLPHPDFVQSARCLDNRRLGKQRVECLQLVKALLLGGSRWASHPAAKMWKGHEQALIQYGVAVCEEWMLRGYEDTCSDKMLDYFKDRKPIVPPSWLGCEDFHASHRSNLLRKDPAWYGRFGWTEPPTLRYVWPI